MNAKDRYNHDRSRSRLRELPLAPFTAGTLHAQNAACVRSLAAVAGKTLRHSGYLVTCKTGSPVFLHPENVLFDIERKEA